LRKEKEERKERKKRDNIVYHQINHGRQSKYMIPGVKEKLNLI
jgi:hypothetical protein